MDVKKKKNKLQKRDIFYGYTQSDFEEYFKWHALIFKKEFDINECTNSLKKYCSNKPDTNYMPNFPYIQYSVFTSEAGSYDQSLQAPKVAPSITRDRSQGASLNPGPSCAGQSQSGPSSQKMPLKRPENGKSRRSHPYNYPTKRGLSNNNSFDNSTSNANGSSISSRAAQIGKPSQPGPFKNELFQAMPKSFKSDSEESSEIPVPQPNDGDLFDLGLITFEDMLKYNKTEPPWVKPFLQLYRSETENILNAIRRLVEKELESEAETISQLKGILAYLDQQKRRKEKKNIGLLDNISAFQNQQRSQKERKKN